MKTVLVANVQMFYNDILVKNISSSMLIIQAENSTLFYSSLSGKQTFNFVQVEQVL